MHKSPLVVAIVVNYNGKSYLKRCLQSLEQQTYPNFEIIVFDNASIDDSAESVKQTFPKITFIDSKKNVGFTGGNNTAIKTAIQKGADYVFLVNNDTESEPTLIAKIVNEMQEDPRVGIAAPIVLNLQADHSIQEMGMSVDRFAYPVPIKSAVARAPMFFTSGCSMMIKTDLLRRIGAFDDSYFMFVEDLDLCWRAQLAGYRLKVVFPAKIYHAGGGSLPGGVVKGSTYRTNVKRIFFREKNTLRTLIKNYSLTNVVTRVPFYVGLLSVEAFFWFSINKPATSKMILKAIMWNVKHLPETMHRRVEVQTARKVSDSEIQKRMIKGYGKLAIFRSVGVPEFAGAS